MQGMSKAGKDFFSKVGARIKSKLGDDAPELLKEAPDFYLGMYASIAWATRNSDTLTAAVELAQEPKEPEPPTNE